MFFYIFFVSTPLNIVTWSHVAIEMLLLLLLYCSVLLTVLLPNVLVVQYRAFYVTEIYPATYKTL